METIEIKKLDLNLQDYIKRTAVETDFKKLINSNTLITENGVPKILYIHIDPKLTEKLREACLNIKYHKGFRSRGMASTSRIFGYTPRNVLRRDFCSATSLASEDQKDHDIICSFGEILQSLYQQYFPDIFQKHKEQVEKKISKDWMIKGTPFTSGIVNKNNPLKYHFDNGNLTGVLSNMVVLKKYVKGGHLSCPEYGIGFEVADNTAIIFDGQDILHGVTPIRKASPNAYRYSIVYYTLQQMWSCLPIGEEIQFARNKRLSREKKRASGLVTMDDLERDNKEDRKAGKKK